MISLSPEVQLDFLKCLNFEQLFSLKLANSYFYNLINKYKGGLARMEFNKLSLIDARKIPSQEMDYYKFIKLEPVISDFVLDDQLMKKWQAAMAESIPLYLHMFEDGIESFAVQLEKRGDKKSRYILKLPNMPKTIEEMIIIRFWLKQLFNCVFDYALFSHIAFNPQIIDLLFDNDEPILKQFYVRSFGIFFSKSDVEFQDISQFFLLIG
uniref:Uncharacterized protein n=1 Tax=Meloidogyne enterolobii TaxID=390850 RepID=A0A6V7X9S7_MELEN|nr:unnamed protein product [Meloidogyne enterolobii]